MSTVSASPNPTPEASNAQVSTGAMLGPCPTCGGLTIAPSTHASILLAVCDVLVTKTLEQIGKAIVREGRSRFRDMAGRPWYLAHTLWRPDPHRVENVTRSAWDVVPALLDTHGIGGTAAGDVTAVLDRYVSDLCASGVPHEASLLATRFRERLGLPVYLPESRRGQHGDDA